MKQDNSLTRIRLNGCVWNAESGMKYNNKRSLPTILGPLAKYVDGHLSATVLALLLFLVESKTDSPITGVFGAGKTRATAATIARLIILSCA